MKIGVGQTDDSYANDAALQMVFWLEKAPFHNRCYFDKNKNPCITELTMTSVFFLNKQ